MRKILSAIVGIAFGLQAAPITLSFIAATETNPVVFDVTLDEIQSGDSRFLTVAADVKSPELGDILALYVDFGSSIEGVLQENDFKVIALNNNVSPSSSIEFTTTSAINKLIIGIDDDMVNLNQSLGYFDVSAAFGDNGIGNKKTDLDPATLIIDVTDTDLSIEDIQKVGIRATSTGIMGDRNGSCKVAYGPMENVPEPGILSLFGTGLLLIVSFARRRKNG